MYIYISTSVNFTPRQTLIKTEIKGKFLAPLLMCTVLHDVCLDVSMNNINRALGAQAQLGCKLRFDTGLG